jgi:hypothetical protein
MVREEPQMMLMCNTTHHTLVDTALGQVHANWIDVWQQTIYLYQIIVLAVHIVRLWDM